MKSRWWAKSSGHGLWPITSMEWRSFSWVRYTEPDTVRDILQELIKVPIAFAKAQIEAGADALTLADHCTRDLCSPQAYEEFLFAIHKELHESIACPLMLHICGDTSDRLKFIRETGIECFHFDSKVGSTNMRELAGEKLALMGGTSNIRLVLNGTPEAIEQDVKEKLRTGVDIIGPVRSPVERAVSEPQADRGTGEEVIGDASGLIIWAAASGRVTDRSESVCARKVRPVNAVSSFEVKSRTITPISSQVDGSLSVRKGRSGSPTPFSTDRIGFCAQA